MAYTLQSIQFARIIPEGLDAENALDEVYGDAELSEHHQKYIRVERTTRKIDHGSSSESDQQPSPQSEYWAGYYTLFLQMGSTQPTTVGWRVGRGSSKTPNDNRGVDILLIRPKAKVRGVAPVHALIQFHPTSGVLMLVGVTDDNPVRYEVNDSDQPFLLRQGQKHVLYQKRNRFVLGKLQYTLVFESFTDQQYSRYQTARRGWLENVGCLAPHQALSAVPRQQDMKRGPVITHGSMSTGAFGWVFSAVDARNGTPLAVKEHRPWNTKSARDVRTELAIGKSFSVS